MTVEKNRMDADGMEDISMYKKQSQFIQAWGRLRKNKVAIVGMVILIILILDRKSVV